jgi:hypothetical protein
VINRLPRTDRQPSDFADWPLFSSRCNPLAFVRLRDHTQEQASDGLRNYLRDLGRLIAACSEYHLYTPQCRRGLKPGRPELLVQIRADTTSVDVAPGPPPALASIASWWQQLPETGSVPRIAGQGRA